MDNEQKEKQYDEEADCFARLLLMDEVSFRTAFTKLKGKMPNRPDMIIQFLAKVFFVPEEQVTIRIRELNLPLL